MIWVWNWAFRSLAYLLPVIPTHLQTLGIPFFFLRRTIFQTYRRRSREDWGGLEEAGDHCPFAVSVTSEWKWQVPASGSVYIFITECASFSLCFWKLLQKHWRGPSDILCEGDLSPKRGCWLSLEGCLQPQLFGCIPYDWFIEQEVHAHLLRAGKMTGFSQQLSTFSRVLS